MGTRADFYVGTGPQAEWLGSITFDGYPGGCPEPIFAATSEADYRAAVEAILGDCESTRPDEGWPWPWEDSRTTDYAYAWTADGVKLSNFGREWQTLAEHKKVEEPRKLRDDEVRDMTALTADSDTIMRKSGLIFVAMR
jgi:hypothetical protein